MQIKDLVSLSNAGFTKDEIIKIMAASRSAPAAPAAPAASDVSQKLDDLFAKYMQTNVNNAKETVDDIIANIINPGEE